MPVSGVVPGSGVVPVSGFSPGCGSDISVYDWTRLAIPSLISNVPSIFASDSVFSSEAIV